MGPYCDNLSILARIGIGACGRIIRTALISPEAKCDVVDVQEAQSDQA